MPLPPIPLDRFRDWATRKWTETTQPLVDDLTHASWALDAQRRLHELADQARAFVPPPPSPPPPPPLEPEAAPAEEPPSRAPAPVTGGLGELAGGLARGVGQTASDMGTAVRGGLDVAGARLGGAVTRPATGVGEAAEGAGDWASQAQEQISGLGEGFQAWRESGGPHPTPWDTLGRAAAAGAAPRAEFEQTSPLAEQARGLTGAIGDVVGRPFEAFGTSMGMTPEQARGAAGSAFEQVGGLAGPPAEEAVTAAGRVARGLGPAEREAVRRARAVGREPPPEVAAQLEALQGAVAAGPEAARGSRALGSVLEVVNNYSLAGPMSLFTNLTSGLAQTGLNVAEAVGAGGPAGAARYARGVAGALPEALREGRRVFFEGTQAPGTALGGTTQELALSGGLSEGPGLGRVLGTWATRANAATDRAIWSLNEAGGRALGEQIGLDGTGLDDFARRYAEEATYAGKPSALGQLFSGARAKLADPDAPLPDRLWGGFAYALAPYVRVPERILRQALDLTTGGAVHVPDLLARDPAIVAQARGRIGAALGTTLALGYQAAHGAITGDGPDDPNERAALEGQRNAAGDPLWRRNSWKVEVPGAGPRGTSRVFWFPNRALGAVGTQMDLVANAVDAYRRASARGGTGVQAGFAGGKALINEVAATALGDSWLDDLTRFAERAGRGQFLEASAETLGGLVGRPLAAAAPLARATDPYLREVERGNPLERAQERIPGLRERLPARIDPTTGQPLVASGTPLERLGGTTPPEPSPGRTEVDRLNRALREEALASPAYRRATTQAERDALLTAARVGVRDYARREAYAGATQTPAQRRVLQRAYGSEVGRATRELLASPVYQRATDAEKAALLRSRLLYAYDLADIQAGAQVARDAKGRADFEYAAVPQFDAVQGTPDQIRRGNAAVRDGRRQLAAYKQRYGDDAGEARFERDWPRQYELTRRRPERADELKERRAAIDRKYGITR
jgi:hypothetical protein